MSNIKFYRQCITEYVQVQEHVVQLQIHPINSNTSTQSSPQFQFWFKDRHLQEVIQLIKSSLFKRVETTSSISDKEKKDEPAYNILTGNTIRLVYTFKKTPARQYFLIMNNCENNLDHFENFQLKNEKMVIFVCQIEKRIEDLLKVVNDSEGLTSSQQTLSISSYFTQLPRNNTENSQQNLDNPETKESADICSSSSSKKEKLKSIVSRVKRLRQKRTSKHKSNQRLTESRDCEKLTSPVSTTPEANGQGELPNLQHSDILKESNHAINSNLASDSWIENLSFNGASLSNSLLSYESDRFSQDNNSDGSTSSDENLPYYGISDKCSDAGGLSSVSSSFEPDFNPDALLGSPPNSPAAFSSSTHTHPTGVSVNQTGENKSGKIKSRCKKKTLKSPRLKDLKESKTKPDVSKGSVSGSNLGIKNVHDLTPKQIMRLVKESEDYLRKIFEGKTASWRHEMYKTGGPERHRLNFHCQFGNLSHKQLDIIMEGLFNIFCKKHLKYEDYVSKVMLAEAIIKIHMDIYKIPHKEAEDMLLKY